jgi:glycosyltransferase involved in cell wall biosynthesis
LNNNFYRLPLFSTVEVQKVIHNKKDDIKCLVWWGSALPLHGLDLMLESFIKLRDKRDDFVLYLCFNSDEKKTEYNNKYGNNSWMFFHSDLRFSDNTLQEFVNYHADIILGAFGNTLQIEYCLFNKYIEALIFNLPILTGYTIGLSEYDDLKNYLFTTERNKKAIAEKANQLLDNIDFYKKMCENKGIKIYNKYFTIKVFEREFYKLIKKLNIYEN